MVRAAVFSDTHGDLLRLPAALARAGRLDAFLHLGDFRGDADAIAAQLELPAYTVPGNCDGYSDTERENVVTLGGARLLLTHGDAYVSTYGIARKAEERGCQAALFGHTHMPMLSAYGPVLLINPGSLSRPRGGSAPSFAVLSIEQGEVNVKMYAL